MELTLRDSVLAFLVSLLISSILTPIFRRLALKLRILDVPNQVHKSHFEPIPYLGGASILASCLLITVISVFTFPELFSSQRNFLLVLLSPILLAAVGLVDDLNNISAGIKFTVQSIVATSVSLILFSQSLFGSPLGITVLDFLISYFWIVGITNAINLLDNLDGGAGGVVVIASISLTLNSILGNQYFLAALSLVLAGTTMGFLIWNVYPARIYLGDSGSLFLGSVISILTLRLDPSTPTTLTSWALAFSIVAVPVLDTALVFVSRLKRGASPFQGSQDHISHRLIAQGLSKRQSAVTIWIIAAYFCLLGIVLNYATLSQSLLAISIMASSWLTLFVYFFRCRSLGGY